MSILTPEERTALVKDAKSRECKEDIITLLGNLPTMRLILAWPTVSIAIDPDFDPRAQHSGGPNICQMNDTKKMWVGVELDFDEIAAATRIPRAVVQEHVFEAQMNRWVYPDGTVHAYARELAKATIVKIAQTKRREGSE